MHSEVIPVWVSGGAYRNDLNGLYGAFQSANCQVRLTLSGHVLGARYENASNRRCGIFMHLFDESDPARPGPPVDLNRYPRLLLRVRGGSDVEVLVADRKLLRADDSRPAGKIAQSTGAPGDDGWRDAALTLDHVRLETREAASLAFAFPPGSSGYFEIDRIVLAARTGAAPIPTASERPQSGPPRPRSMWFWEFSDCFDNPQRWSQAISFARKQGVTSIYAQVAYECDAFSGSPRCELTAPSRLQGLIAEARAADIRIHALDGAPEYAHSRNHPHLLAVVRAILAYNSSSPPESRFSGVHLDIEPYLLPGFESRRRHELLRQYLALHRDAAQLVRSQSAGLEFGADIPFWYDEGANLNVTFDGKTQDVSKHIIDIVDTAVLMDYRNFAFGADGIVHHAAGEIAYATAGGKRVMIGVETLPQEPETIVFLAGLPEGWLDRASDSLLFERLIGGFPLRLSGDGERRFVGLSPAGTVPENDRFQKALAQLARLAGAAPLDAAAREAALNAARRAVARQSDYTGFTAIDAPSLAAFAVTGTPIAKITFAGQSPPEMEAALKAVEDYFSAEIGYAGIAIHAFKSWSAMFP